MKCIILTPKLTVKKVYLTKGVNKKGFGSSYYIGRTKLSQMPVILKQGNELKTRIKGDLYYKISSFMSTYDFEQKIKGKYFELDLSEDCDQSISYYDENRFNAVLNGKKDINDSNFRYRMKFGKFLSKLGYNQQDIEKYFNKFKPLKGTFEFVNGEDIPYWYNENRYESDSDTLNGSCMGNKDAEYFEIYEDNCEMLILKTEHNTIMGRALIWETSIGKVMDRIYGNDVTVEQFKQYAIDKGITYKTEQNYSNKTSFVINGIIQNLSLSIDLKYDISRYNYFPYMDTFTYLDDQVVANTNIYNYAANNTDGTLEGYNDGDYVIDYNGERQLSENVTYIDQLGEYYPDHMIRDTRNGVFLADECVQIGYNYYHRDDKNIVWSSYNDEYMLHDDSYYSETEDDYFYSNQVVYVDNDNINDYLLEDNVINIDGENYCIDNCVKIDGEWYHKDSDEITEENGTYFLISQLQENE